MRRWSEKTEIPAGRFIAWLGIAPSKFYSWRGRYGCVNEHNAWVPRDFWLQEWEKQAILDFYRQHPLQGYRRLTFHDARRRHRGRQPVERLAGVEPGGPAAQVEGQNVAERDGLPTASATASALAYRCFPTSNISGTFYYLCSVLDGYSRSIVHWNLREAMREADVEIILEAAKEKYPRAKPRIISDNGPQFIAKDFKEFIRISGMTHVRTSPYYPQSNGKLERWHKSLKSECIRPGVPLTPEDARAADRALCRALQHRAGAQRDRIS